MDKRLKIAIDEAGRDDVGVRTRQEVSDAATAALRSGGQILWVGGYILGTDRRDGESPFDFGSDATVALATVMQIAGELLSGATVLFKQDNLYAAAALVRQLVEVEYLAWAFAEDEDEARNWMRSSKEDRQRFWQPRHIRERADGRFRGSDYGEHCGRGGHPSPEGAALLPDHSSSVGLAPLWWYDMVSHGLSVWSYSVAAGGKLGYADQLASIDEQVDLTAAKERWRKEDPLIGALEAVNVNL